MPKVKVCGITNLADALLACELGADALGFIFYAKSPRCIAPDRAREIVRELPPFVTIVGVFVNAAVATVNKSFQNVGIEVAQLHGDETPSFARKLKGKYVKVLRVRDELPEETLRAFGQGTFLLDTLDSTRYGGTGQTYDWTLARSAKDYGRVILSGGLNPDNVAGAMALVLPYAVDVCSGVEAQPGKKDPKKLHAFFKAVKTPNNQ